MSKRIKGITIELDGDTKGLDKALKDVNKESRDIQRELRDVDRLLRFNPKNTELVAQKQKLLGDQVETTKKKLEQLKGSQEQVTKAFEAGEISEEQYRNFQREIAETESKLKHYEGQLKDVDKTQRSFGDKMVDSGAKVKEFGDKMTTVGKELSLKVTAPLTAIAGIATNIGMDFRTGLSEVQALSGATGEELAQLEDQARELGSTTKFSAKEVTDGFKYMALAGWDVQQSLDGIDGVLNLAAASGEDLGRVSDILTDSISAFGDEASDAGRYADVLAAASSNANTDVAGLGESFKMVAPVAGSLGYSLEDTAVALGLMANSGIKGSQAGTTLRSALTNLVSPTDKMQKTMKDLGIEIQDSSGEMKPLDELIGDLRHSFADLDDEQKASAASTLFGKQAMSGMLAVINAGEGDFDKLTSAVANSDGVAQEMADTMQNNLAGKLTNLRSALEELAIKIFDALEPALNAIIGGAQKLVDWMNGLSKKTQLVVVAIGALAAAIGPLMLVFGPLLSVVGGLMVSLPALAPVIAALAGPVGIVVGALTALGTVYALTRTKADEAYASQLQEAEGNLELAQSYTEVLDEKSEQLDATTELINKTQEQMEATDELVDSFEGLIDKSKLSTDEFGEFLTLQTELEHTKSPQSIKEIEDRMEELRKKSGLSKDEFKNLLESNQALAEQFPEAGKVIDDYGNIIMDTTGKLHEMTQAELDRMQMEIYNEMIDDLRAVNEEIDDYNDLIGETLELEESVSKTKSEISDIQKDIKANEEEIKDKNDELLDIKEQMKDASFGEWWELDKQKNSIQEQIYNIENKQKENKKNLETVEETLSTEEQTLEEKQKQSDKISELIDKNNVNYDMYVDILGKQFDINIERDKENESIDKGIKKREEEIKKLEDKIKKEGDSNGELQQSIEHLETENSQLEDLKGKLDGMNSSLDDQNSKYTDTQLRLEKVSSELLDAGGLTDKNISKADLWNDTLSKDQKKNVNVEGLAAAKGISDEAARGVTKTVTVNAKPGTGLSYGAIGSLLPGYKDGTNFHPGGKAMVGEEGPELVEHGGKISLASLGVYDLPVGAKVHTNEDTIDMIRSGLVSGISQGIGLHRLSSGNMGVSGLNNQQLVQDSNGEVVSLLRDIAQGIRDGKIIEIEGREITQVVNENNAIDDVGNYF